MIKIVLTIYIYVYIYNELQKECDAMLYSMIHCWVPSYMGTVTDMSFWVSQNKHRSPMIISFNYLLKQILAVYYNHLNKPFSQFCGVENHFISMLIFFMIYFLESDVKAYCLLNHYSVYWYIVNVKKGKNWKSQEMLGIYTNTFSVD